MELNVRAEMWSDWCEWQSEGGGGGGWMGGVSILKSGPVLLTWRAVWVRKVSWSLWKSPWQVYWRADWVMASVRDETRTDTSSSHGALAMALRNTLLKALKCERGFKITLFGNSIIKMKEQDERIWISSIHNLTCDTIWGHKSHHSHSFGVRKIILFSLWLKFIFLSQLADFFLLVLSFNSLNFDHLFQKTRLEKRKKVVFLLNASWFKNVKTSVTIFLYDHFACSDHDLNFFLYSHT